MIKNTNNDKHIGVKSFNNMKMFFIKPKNNPKFDFNNSKTLDYRKQLDAIFSRIFDA